VAAVLLGALLLNLHTRLLALAWAAGLGLAWLLSPLCWHVGHFVWEETPLASLLATLDGKPLLLLFLFDLDRYTTLGHLVVGLPLAAASARVSWWLGLRIAAWRGRPPRQERLLRPGGFVLLTVCLLVVVV